MKTIQLLVLLGAAILLHVNASAQGCVAVRPMGCTSSGNNLGILSKGEWQLGASYQYFESFRHFRGDHEEANRVADGTQVINTSHIVELSANTALTSRCALSLVLPYQSYTRSSLYEHYGNSLDRNPTQQRFSTAAQGFGDARVTMNYWLWEPSRDSLRGNMSLGMGVKLPTGQSNVLGEFHKLNRDGNDSIAVRPVDQSIQLGDGSWGINLEMQGFVQLFRGCWGYATGFYLVTPREVNYTLRRGSYEGRELQMDYLSVADQYLARMGLNFQLPSGTGLSVRAGGQVAGVPAHDLIGGSEGYRRPGYTVSVEPGLSWVRKQLTINVNVPVAMYRNRIKSVYDLSDPTGQRHGDAAFADYQVGVTALYRINAHFDHATMPAMK